MGIRESPDLRQENSPQLAGFYKETTWDQKNSSRSTIDHSMERN